MKYAYALNVNDTYSECSSDLCLVRSLKRGRELIRKLKELIAYNKSFQEKMSKVNRYSLIEEVKPTNFSKPVQNQEHKKLLEKRGRGFALTPTEIIYLEGYETLQKKNWKTYKEKVSSNMKEVEQTNIRLKDEAFAKYCEEHYSPPAELKEVIDLIEKNNFEIVSKFGF